MVIVKGFEGGLLYWQGPENDHWTADYTLAYAVSRDDAWARRLAHKFRANIDTLSSSLAIDGRDGWVLYKDGIFGMHYRGMHGIPSASLALAKVWISRAHVWQVSRDSNYEWLVTSVRYERERLKAGCRDFDKTPGEL